VTVQQPSEAEMSLFTRREKLALLRSQLSEAQTQEQREEILKLLAEEETKDGIIGLLFSKPKDVH
jgi:hypothetical protein